MIGDHSSLIAISSIYVNLSMTIIYILLGSRIDKGVIVISSLYSSELSSKIGSPFFENNIVRPKNCTSFPFEQLVPFSSKIA